MVPITLPNVAAIELQTEPSSNNKQGDCYVSPLYGPPKGGHPTREDHFIEKNIKTQGPFSKKDGKD